MRARVIILAAAAVLQAGAALAIGAVVNEVPLPPGTPLADCMRRGAAALTEAGLQLLPAGPISQAAQVPNTQELFVVYCSPAAPLAVVVGAAERSAVASPVVIRIRDSIAEGLRGGPPRGAPGGAPGPGGGRK